jgi:hypothetical protein
MPGAPKDHPERERFHMKQNAIPTNGGIGVCSALGIAFVVLKLCGVIGWDWWWVLAPFWIPPAALALVLAAIFTGKVWSASATRSLARRTGSDGRALSGPEEEPVHGWTKRQLDDYLARNPGYRATYEIALEKHR